MTYAIRQDYIDRFGATELLQLTDRDRDDVEDPGVLDRAIADASAEIEGYLQVKYELPLPSTPPALVRVCCDIVRYRLFDQRATEEVARRYTEAVRYLVSISNGTVQLGLPTPAPSSLQDNAPLYVAADRVFSRDSLTDFTRDFTS